MMFEEAREVIQGLKGRTVDVSFGFPESDGELRSLGGISGRVERVTRSRARTLPEHWYVWIESGERTPGPTFFSLDAAMFQGGSVEGSDLELDEVVEREEREGEAGTTWTLTLRHYGVVTDVLIYV